MAILLFFGRRMIGDRNHISKETYANCTICSTCHRPLLDEFYCHCLKCKSFNQCIHCLQNEIKSREHIPSHPCVLVGRGDASKYDEKWSLFEEINLIHSLQLHGYENWREVSQCVGTKTALECKEHYEEIYLNHNQAPHPKSKTSSHHARTLYPLFDELSNPVIGFDDPLAKDVQEAKTYGQFSGFMPNRDEYETEPDNEAEAMLSGISFSIELETDDTIDEKIKLIDDYTKIVQKRQLQHEFVKSTELLDLPIGAKSDEFRNSLVRKGLYPLLRFINKETAESILKIIQNEELTYQKIKEEISWLANGIKSRSEGKIFSKILKIINENDPDSIESWNLKFGQKCENQEFVDELYNSLLSEIEISFCKKEKISLSVYANIKEYITVLSLQEDHITLSQLLYNRFNDWNIVKKVFVFMVNNGYISSDVSFICEEEDTPDHESGGEYNEGNDNEEEENIMEEEDNNEEEDSTGQEDLNDGSSDNAVTLSASQIPSSTDTEDSQIEIDSRS